MYNPDQHYQAHKLHLKDLYAQAEHSQMIATLTQHRQARVRAASRRLGVLLVTLGTWLMGCAQRDEQLDGCCAIDLGLSDCSQG